MNAATFYAAHSTRNTCCVFCAINTNLFNLRLPILEAKEYSFVEHVSSVVLHNNVQGVANRDIKLENTLLDSTTRPLIKICDFGYSKVELCPCTSHMHSCTHLRTHSWTMHERAHVHVS